MKGKSSIWVALLWAASGCGEDAGTMNAVGGTDPGTPMGPAAGEAPTGPSTPGAGPAVAQPGQNPPGVTAPEPDPTVPGAEPGAMPGADPGPDPAGDGACAEQGLELEGLMYSPGGTALPFPCEPFDATKNNPYAVRCIDAWSWYKTDFPGDEYCILPPEPGKGVQVGVHPQGMDWYAQVSTGDMSGYENVADEFLMNPGQEEERNYVTGSPNAEEISFYRNNVRMRPGSHHMIVSAAEQGGAAGPRGSWVVGSVGGLSGGNGSVPGAQRPDENTPQTLQKPEEDNGLYSVLGANSDVTYNMHHFNASEDVTLKEAWTNLWFEDDTTIRSQGIFGMPLTQALQTFAQPGQTVDVHYQWDISEDIRVVRLFGHRHAWTTNFVAWVKKPDGAEDIIYQSFDWYDQPTYRYDSQQVNPEPMPEQLRDGGHSGVLILKPGDELHMNCHISFLDERAEVVGAPMPGTIGPLRFANQAFQGEMCILFGATAGASLGSPGTGRGELPGFATIDEFNR